MSNQIDDGGPAFANMTANSCGPVNPRREGMSLRDYAAIHADIDGYKFTSMSMAAAFAGMPDPGREDLIAQFEVSAACVARMRYMLADAMLAARTEGE